MSSEAGREDFGMTEKGRVVVIEKNFFEDYGPEKSFYVVKHGVRTVGEFSTRKAADAVAKALVA